MADEKAAQMIPSMPIAELSFRMPTEIAHNWSRNSMSNGGKPPRPFGIMVSRKSDPRHKYGSLTWIYRKPGRRFIN